MMYIHTIHLNNTGKVKISSPELPQLSEHSLLHFVKESGDNVTFVLANVAYFTTKQVSE